MCAQRQLQEAAGAYVMLLMLALPMAASATSFWDTVPVVSQFKALIQGMTGDFKAAEQTTMNFLNEGIVTSQLRSAYFYVIGDHDKALDVQKTFALNMEPVLDSTPVLGHIKGVVHLAVGDTAHGWSAIKQATSTVGSVAGAAIAGPLGAVAGHVVADGVVSLIDFAVNGDQAQPHGVVDYAMTLGKRGAGEHFDAVAGIVMNGITGSVQPLKKSDHGPQQPPPTPSPITPPAVRGPPTTSPATVQRPPMMMAAQ